MRQTLHGNSPQRCLLEIHPTSKVTLGTTPSIVSSRLGQISRHTVSRWHPSMQPWAYDTAVFRIPYPRDGTALHCAALYRIASHRTAPRRIAPKAQGKAQGVISEADVIVLPSASPNHTVVSGWGCSRCPCRRYCVGQVELGVSKSQLPWVGEVTSGQLVRHWGGGSCRARFLPWVLYCIAELLYLA